MKHPRITVVEDIVVLPNNSKTTYIRTPTNGNAATIICIDRERILIQKEYSYPSNMFLFQFPGGLIPEGENVKSGANRELMEEAGLKAGNLKLLGKYLLNNRRSDAYMHVFLATKLQEAKLDGDLEENIESYWFSEREIDKMVGRNDILNGHTLSSWALYKATMLKEGK